MGFLDEASQLLGGGSDAGNITQLATALINQHGGVQGLLDTLSQGGLGEHVASWVGSGQNLGLNADTLQQVLGSDRVQALAGSLGIDPQQVTAQLSQHLPAIINALTPDGQVPQGGGLLAEGESMLKGLFG